MLRKKEKEVLLLRLLTLRMYEQQENMLTLTVQVKPTTLKI